MKNIILSSITATILLACDGDGGNVITTIVTSATVGPVDTSATSDESTTSTSTGEEEPTTSATEEPDSTTTTTGTTGVPDFSCLPKEPMGPKDTDGPDGFQCKDAPAADDFCSYVADRCAQHEIEPAYCSIIADKCPRTLGCTVCFELTNYCHQLGTDCEDMYFECGCVADALGVE